MTTSQTSLFAEVETQQITLPDADILYLPAWFSSQGNTQMVFEQLKQQVPWQQSDIVIYGKTMKIPRLNAWYGDSGKHYSYSGTEFQALPWLPMLLEIKHKIEQVLAPYLQGTRFNSALVNCYRNGQDSVAWHSDDEPELGRNPIVASLSLGAEREFQLKHRHNKQYGKHRLLLADGDLLLMYGTMQHYWHHQIPKTQSSIGERINITFRHVYPLNA